MNPLSLLAGIRSPYLYALVAVIAAAAGFKGGGLLASVEIQSLHTAIAEQRAEHAEQAQRSAEQAAKRLQQQTAAADAAAHKLAEQQRLHRETTDRLTREVRHVSTLYRKALDAAPEPVPACVFTAGWVRSYDTATGAVPDADPGRAAAPPTAADPAQQLASGLDQGDILAHHIAYAEQCRNTAAQLNELIDLLETR